jgi:hypothetical protein
LRDIYASPFFCYYFLYSINIRYFYFKKSVRPEQ